VADAIAPALLTDRIGRIVSRYSSLAAPIAIVAMLAVIIVPMPAFIMDVLIGTNLALSAIVLLTTLYIKSPLDFSVFPSLLLATTLFRLVLNVASTRLILSADAATPQEVTGVAGGFIETFGHFVTGGSIVVGTIIFIILIVVQFVVITKGATRISEVAARFTLDGMPGKQMAIDADLNAGTINETQARQRREAIAREADFYGAMDGASKFVRGDAVAGIIITLINVLGGFAIGVWEKGWPMVDTMEAFTRLTIGDGLTSQIPAFTIAIASGLIVTRSGSRADLGDELTDQLTSQPITLAITSGFLALMAFAGLPTGPMLAMSAGLGTLAWYNHRATKAKVSAEKAAESAKKTADAAPPPVEKLLNVDTMELEIGYGLVKLVDTKQGGDLLARISGIRRDTAVELGLVVPPVRIRDNMQLQSNDYHIRIRGNVVARGTVYPGKFMAIDNGLADRNALISEGIKTREPAFGMDAWWIDAVSRTRAELANFTVVEASLVLATHLTEVIKSHAEELLTREETSNLITQLKEKSPKLVEEVVGTVVKAGELQKVLQNLLRERVPIRDLETILETLGDWGTRTKDLDVLTEYTRNALRRTICTQYAQSDPAGGATRLYCVTLDPAVEDLINGYIDRSASGTSVSIPPSVANRVNTSVLAELQKLIAAGHHPVLLASPQVRASVRKMLEPYLPNVAVLGYNEIVKGVEVESLGLVQLEPEAQASIG
jgi:flagellar biosynthesis protein FlhA